MWKIYYFKIFEYCPYIKGVSHTGWNGSWPDPVGQEVVLTLPKSIIQSYPGGLSPEAASFHVRFDKEDHQIKAKSCQNIKANLS